MRSGEFVGLTCDSDVVLARVRPGGLGFELAEPLEVVLVRQAEVQSVRLRRIRIDIADRGVDDWRRRRRHELGAAVRLVFRDRGKVVTPYDGLRATADDLAIDLDVVDVESGAQVPD